MKVPKIFIPFHCSIFNLTFKHGTFNKVNKGSVYNFNILIYFLHYSLFSHKEIISKRNFVHFICAFNSKFCIRNKKCFDCFIDIGIRRCKSGFFFDRMIISEFASGYFRRTYQVVKILLSGVLVNQRKLIIIVFVLYFKIFIIFHYYSLIIYYDEYIKIILFFF